MAHTPEHWHYSDNRLGNGLRVLTLEDHRVPIAAVQVWFHVGSKDEDPQRQGFAHMFEHMMFRGTERVGPQDHFRHLNRHGARVNGYTSFDQTVYWDTLPAPQLEVALWLEAERLANLKINADYFAAEREVVKEERRKNYLNRPYGRLYETLFNAAYREHPYRWTPIGNMQHLNAATVDELRAFFEAFYVPNNTTLVVAGAVRHEEVMEKVQRHFGPLPRRPDPPRVQCAEPPITKPRRVEITDRAPSPLITLAHHAPAAPDPQAIPVHMLTHILSGGQSSRLYRSLVEDRRLAVDVNAGDYLLEQHGLFTLLATFKPEVPIPQAEEALGQEVERLLATGIEPAELDKARNRVVADHVRQGATVEGRAQLLGYAAVILGDPERVNTDLERMRAVTVDEVHAAARAMLSSEARVTIVIRPDPNPPPVEEAQDVSGGTGEAIAKLPRPEGMPAGMRPRPAAVPRPVRRTLANGLEVIVLSDHATPAVSLSLDALTGAREDPVEQPGLTYVTANLLRRGTTRHTGPELAERTDFHALRISQHVHHDDLSIYTWTLTENLPLAVETLAEIVREPTFPDDEVRDFASRAASREAINEATPSWIAQRRLDELLFGDHPRSRPSHGTSGSLRSIGRDAVTGHYPDLLGSGVSKLFFAGDIDADDALALAERWLGDWHAQARRTTAPTPPASAARRIVLVDQPGATQSEIRIGQLVPVSRKDADYPAVRLLSHAFGESFSSRLTRSLRIEKGLTYDARGGFEVGPDLAAFRISTFTRTEQTARAIDTALTEMAGLRTAGVTRDELDEARDTLIGHFQMSLETPSQIADHWWRLILWGLPDNWYEEYLHALASIADPGALTAVAETKLDPQRVTIVVVGDAARLERDLGTLAPVTRAGTVGEARPA